MWSFGIKSTLSSKLPLSPSNTRSSKGVNISCTRYERETERVRQPDRRAMRKVDRLSHRPHSTRRSVWKKSGVLSSPNQKTKTCVLQGARRRYGGIPLIYLGGFLSGRGKCALSVPPTYSVACVPRRQASERKARHERQRMDATTRRSSGAHGVRGVYWYAF